MKKQQLEPGSHKDVVLEPEPPEKKLESTELADIALQHPAEEPRVRTTVRKLYDFFIGDPHPVIPDRTISGRLRGGGVGSGGKKSEGVSENAGNTPAGCLWEVAISRPGCDERQRRPSLLVITNMNDIITRQTVSTIPPGLAS